MGRTFNGGMRDGCYKIFIVTATSRATRRYVGTTREAVLAKIHPEQIPDGTTLHVHELRTTYYHRIAIVDRAGYQYVETD